MNDKFLESSVNEKKQILKYVFEEMKKNQNYEVDFELNGLKKFPGNVLSDKEVFLGSLKKQFSLSKTLLEEICMDLALSKKEVQDIYTLIKRDVEPILNKWFSEKAIQISSEENVRYDSFNIDVEEATNEVLDKSAIENQISNLVYMLGEYYEIVQHYDFDNTMHLEYFFSEYDLIKFVREYISTSMEYQDFIKQLQTIEFTIKELEEPVIILGDKTYIEEKNGFYFKINKNIINALSESEDEEEDDDSFGSLF